MPQPSVTFMVAQASLAGAWTADPATPPFAGGVWFCAAKDGVGLSFDLRKRRPAGAAFIWFDLLLDGRRFVTFRLRVRSADGDVLSAQFGALHGCQTRVTLALPATDMARAETLEIAVARKTPEPARFCLGAITFCAGPPPRLDTPALPDGPLVDELGQSTRHDWPARTRDAGVMMARLRRARAAARHRPWPASYGRWGDWAARRLESTGFFRTHHDGRRWWLVAPDGGLFWSSGADCVHPTIDHEIRLETRWMNAKRAVAGLPDPCGPFAAAFGRNPWHDEHDREFNPVVADFIRAFGSEQWYAAWREATLGELRRIGFNTLGDWSDEAFGRDERFPYTRPLELGLRFRRAPMLVGDFPDVFHEGLEADAETFAEPLRATADDPALLGYFLHNEPHWWADDGFTSPAEAMLRHNARGRTREALVAFLRQRYADDARLVAAWGAGASFTAAAAAAWPGPFTPAAKRDLDTFATAMLRRLFGALSAACRRADPNHLNLGVRWWTFPPRWALEAMGSFDVISFNCYQPTVNRTHYGRPAPEDGLEAVCAALARPFIVGEWHFGALDAGLPSAGLYGVENQAERGRAYRVYLERAAALDWCVGAHWFNLYDRSALSTSTSGENYNIGFLDITHRRHEPICRAARATHERLYAVASGAAQPFDAPVRFIFPSR